MLTILLVGLAVLGILFGAAALATYEGDVLRDPHPDDRPAVLPETAMQPEDVAELRFDLALRGYRMSEVDAALHRLAQELAERDARIAELEDALSDHEPPAAVASPDPVMPLPTEAPSAEAALAWSTTSPPAAEVPVADVPVAAEPLAEPTPEPTPEPVTQAAEPVTASAAEPLAQPLAQPLAEPVVEPVAEPVEQPVAQAEPVAVTDAADPVPAAATEAVAEPAAQALVPAAEPAPVVVPADEAAPAEQTLTDDPFVPAEPPPLPETPVEDLLDQTYDEPAVTEPEALTLSAADDAFGFPELHPPEPAVEEPAEREPEQRQDWWTSLQEPPSGGGSSRP